MRRRFRVENFERPGRAATVTIEGGAGRFLFAVRPMYARRDYVLSMADVARFVMEKVIKAEVAEAIRARPGR